MHAYRVHFSPTDRDGILIFACPQERTEPEEAETRDRAQEDIKKAEAAKRHKQADEGQEQKVTFQDRTRSLDSVHMYRVHSFPIYGDQILIFACPKERTEREEADRKKAEAAKHQKQVDEEQQQR